MFELNGSQIITKEYLDHAGNTTDGRRAGGILDEAWEVKIRNGVKYAVPVGSKRFDLAVGVTKGGYIAYLYEKYPIVSRG